MDMIAYLNDHPGYKVVVCIGVVLIAAFASKAISGGINLSWFRWPNRPRIALPGRKFISQLIMLAVIIASGWGIYTYFPGLPAELLKWSKDLTPKNWLVISLVAIGIIILIASKGKKIISVATAAGVIIVGFLIFPTLGNWVEGAKETSAEFKDVVIDTQIIEAPPESTGRWSEAIKVPAGGYNLSTITIKFENQGCWVKQPGQAEKIGPSGGLNVKPVDGSSIIHLGPEDHLQTRTALSPGGRFQSKGPHPASVKVTFSLQGQRY